MLYVIPTPIWNLEDITLRALNLFKQLNIFICEDTRTFKNLLSKYEILFHDKKFFSITSYTPDKKIKFYTELIKNNDVGLVSEAGTPGLSDPWKELIRICRENNIKFEILPWANSLIPAVVSTCFDSSKFLYLGFLPKKKWRQTLLKKIVNETYPVFFYESVYRVEKTLGQLKDLWFDWIVFIIREISKKFEQKYCWHIQDILQKIEEGSIKLKWEFVIWLKKN